MGNAQLSLRIYLLNRMRAKVLLSTFRETFRVDGLPHKSPDWAPSYFCTITDRLEKLSIQKKKFIIIKLLLLLAAPCYVYYTKLGAITHYLNLGRCKIYLKFDLYPVISRSIHPIQHTHTMLMVLFSLFENHT